MQFSRNFKLFIIIIYVIIFFNAFWRSVKNAYKFNLYYDFIDFNGFYTT
jgi:hypothetical protein